MAGGDGAWASAGGWRSRSRHDRVSLGRTDAGVKTDTGETLGNELGRRSTLVPIRRIGRNRLDSQEIEQPVEAFLEVGVDLREYSGQRLRRCHMHPRKRMIDYLKS